jgi:hypothetical protein
LLLLSHCMSYLCVLPKLLLEDAKGAWAAHVVRHQLVNARPDVLARHNLQQQQQHVRHKSSVLAKKSTALNTAQKDMCMQELHRAGNKMLET